MIPFKKLKMTLNSIEKKNIFQMYIISVFSIDKFKLIMFFFFHYDVSIMRIVINTLYI